MNTATDYLKNGYIYDNRPITKAQLDYIRDEAKLHKRKQRVRTDHLNPKEYKKAVFITTILGHISELMVDCLDEMIDMKIIGKEHDFNIVRDKCIYLSNYFINFAIERGETEFMQRQNQHIKFEEFFKNIVNMDIEQLHALMNFAENIKYKSK